MPLLGGYSPLPHCDAYDTIAIYRCHWDARYHTGPLEDLIAFCIAVLQLRSAVPIPLYLTDGYWYCADTTHCDCDAILQTPDDRSTAGLPFGRLPFDLDARFPFVNLPLLLDGTLPLLEVFVPSQLIRHTDSVSDSCCFQ